MNPFSVIKGLPGLAGRVGLAAAGAAVLLHCAADPKLLRERFTDWTYFIVLGMTAFFAWTNLRYWSGRAGDLRTFFRSHTAVLLSAAALCAVVFWTVPPRLRILADESNLMAASRVMLVEKKADQYFWVVRQHDQIRPLKRAVPLRPPLFPFFLHVVHAVLGYGVRNAFILNGMVLFLFLAVIGCLLQRLRDGPAAVSGMLLVAAQPLVSLAATSGHYDLFFAFFILLCGISVAEYLKRPSPGSFDVLCINLVMQAHIRHESFLYSGIAALILAACGRIRAADIRRSWAFWLAPLFAAPVAWHVLLTYVPMRSFVPPGTDAFSIAHFVRQNSGFLKNLLRFDFALPYANVVCLAGLAGLIRLGFGIKQSRPWADPDKRALALVSVSVLVSLWTVLTSVYWGESSHAASARFYLVPSVLLSLLAWAGWNSMRGPAARSGVLLAVSICVWFIYHPVAVKAGQNFTLTIWKENRFVSDFFSRRPDQDFLLVVNQAHKYSIYDYGAVNFPYANRHLNALLRQRRDHVFGRIFVAQKISIATMKPVPLNELDGSYRLRTVAEKAVSRDGHFIRISEVINP